MHVEKKETERAFFFFFANNIRNDVEKQIDFKYNVKPPQACLNCHVYEDFGFPHSIYHGELVPVVIGLSNSGSLSAANIRIRLNLPQFMCISKLSHNVIRSWSNSIGGGNDQEQWMKWLDDLKVLTPVKFEESDDPSSTLASSKTQNKSDNDKAPSDSPVQSSSMRNQAPQIGMNKWMRNGWNDMNASHKQLPDDDILCLNEVIKPGRVSYAVVWLHGAMVGDFLLQILIGYDSLLSVTAKSDLSKEETIKSTKTQSDVHQTPQRLICLSRQLLVDPLLNMTLFTRNHFSDTRQYILALEIENVSNDILKYQGKANTLTTFGLADLLTHPNTSSDRIVHDVEEMSSLQLAQLQPLLSFDTAATSARNGHKGGIVENAIESELDNEQKRNALRILSDEERSPWVVVTNVVCIAENWTIQALLDNKFFHSYFSFVHKKIQFLPHLFFFFKKTHRIIVPIKGQFCSTMFAKLIPLDATNSEEYDSFTLDKDYTISTDSFELQEEEEPVLTNIVPTLQLQLQSQVSTIENEIVKKVLNPAKEIVHNFVKKEVPTMVRQNTTYHKRHDNELDIIIEFQITESPKLSHHLETLTSQSSSSPSSPNSMTRSASFHDRLSDIASKADLDVQHNPPNNSSAVQPPLISLPRPTRPSGFLDRSFSSQSEDMEDQRLNQITREQMEIKIRNELSHMPKSLRKNRYGFHMLNEPFVFSQVESHIGCPLRVAIKYPKMLPMTVKLSKLDMRACKNLDQKVSCDVQLMVLNISRKFNVSFLFDTLAQNEEFDNELKELCFLFFSTRSRSFVTFKEVSLRARYQWSGSTSLECDKLAPGEYIYIELRTIFDTPGIYNLNRYRFSVKTFPLDQSHHVPFLFVLSIFFYLPAFKKHINRIQTLHQECSFSQCNI
ncbi:hypothetical protein RFI_27222 [Reticulomyxa filosa]|uniref:Uncharacterized protein n=1 Tax=Reticulomyxa filosa TaxID=46433 RepID=X6M8B1_RETFI|nr:hypothetical protein RFI_27222 [Reticulomyxa filosa]|eukprot:ETO10154.1 hypothetical protein RFI_27222 [Reticulomyxa filosa]